MISRADGGTDRGTLNRVKQCMGRKNSNKIWHVWYDSRGKNEVFSHKLFNEDEIQLEQ